MPLLKKCFITCIALNFALLSGLAFADDYIRQQQQQQEQQQEQMRQQQEQNDVNQRQEDEANRQQRQQEEANRIANIDYEKSLSRFGALAITADHSHFGISRMAKTADEANLKALSLCGHYGCKIVDTYVNAYLFLTESKQGSFDWIISPSSPPIPACIADNTCRFIGLYDSKPGIFMGVIESVRGWGAIAWNKTSNQFALSINQLSRPWAENYALEACGVNTCAVFQTFANTCISVGKEMLAGKEGLVTGYGATYKEADKELTEECKQAKSQCTVVQRACSFTNAASIPPASASAAAPAGAKK